MRFAIPNSEAVNASATILRSQLDHQLAGSREPKQLEGLSEQRIELNRRKEQR